MHGAQAIGMIQPVIRRFWFSGYDFNATPSSRAALTDTLQNGYNFCFDPEVVHDALNTGVKDGAVFNGGLVVTPTAGSSTTKMPASTFPGGAYTPDSGTTYFASTPAMYGVNVTQPKTGICNLYAGFLVNAPVGGITSAMYSGGAWIDLCVGGIGLCYVKSNTGTLGYGAASNAAQAVTLVPITAQWYLQALAGTIASGTANGAWLQQYCVRALVNYDASTTAANIPVAFGGFNGGQW